MVKDSPRLFWPQNLGPYETDLRNFIISFQQMEGCNQQLGLIDSSLKELHSYPNSQEEMMRYRAYLYVLADLLRQEWVAEIRQGQLYLSSPGWASKAENETENRNQKESMRRSLMWEREAQFERDSVREFIRHMEQNRSFEGNLVSIRSLIADGQALAHELRTIREISDKSEQKVQISSAIKPYLQLITPNSRCSFTGFYLQDIWRYFRYTWSTPYNSTPGRQMFYLVRDAVQPYHPIIGIAALGSSLVQLTVRDDIIGWTPKAFQERIHASDFTDDQAIQIVRMLHQTLQDTLCDLAVDDLITHDELSNPTPKTFENLANIERKNKEDRRSILKKYQNRQKVPIQESELPLIPLIGETILSDDAKSSSVNMAQDALYRAKRAGVLRHLLQAHKSLEDEKQNLESKEGLRIFWQTTDGQHAIKTLMRENKKRRIGINMMDIIVCGSIPPYNILLGGKLVSMLLTSPQIVYDYLEKYADYASKIATQMKGEEVKRAAKLVFLGTTSLYAGGSSQYNRITIPVMNGSSNESVRYIRYGLTEGYGSVHFSKETVDALTTLQEFIQGARLINNRFGEGVNPKLRRIRTGLAAIGLASADDFLRHRSQRIVYGVPLGRNSYKFLSGEADNPDYYFKATSDAERKQAHNYICHFWATRWLLSRIQLSDKFLKDVASFQFENLLLSPYVSSEHSSQQAMNL